MGESIGISPERCYSGNLPHRCPDQPGTAKRERGTCSEDCIRSIKNRRPAAKTIASADDSDQESPIFSPDPGSGMAPLSRPLNRSEIADDFPSLAPPSKPELCPDQPISPNLATRHQSVLENRGVLATDARAARVRLSDPGESKPRVLAIQSRSLFKTA